MKSRKNHNKIVKTVKLAEISLKDFTEKAKDETLNFNISVGLLISDRDVYRAPLRIPSPYRWARSRRSVYSESP